MFDKLCKIYEKENKQQKCVLMQEFFNCTYQKDADTSMHISKLENLVYRLKALEMDISEQMLISKIISTLPENYKHFCSAWECTPKKERSLDQSTARLVAKESRNKNSEEMYRLSSKQ